MSATGPKKASGMHHSCCYCSMMPVCLPKNLALKDVTELNAIVERDFALSPGAPLVNSQAPLTYLYAVRFGSLKEYSLDEEGAERIIDFYFPGQVVGLNALHQRKYAYSVTALEQSSVCAIPFNKLLDLMHKIPSLQDRLLNMVSQKLLDGTLINKHQRAEKRLISFLRILAKSSMQRECPFDGYHLSMSRYDIAKYLNLTTETVSRAFTTLKNKGVITIDHKEIYFNAQEAL